MKQIHGLINCLLVVGALALGGCGKKGPLSVEDPNPLSGAQASPTPTPASCPNASPYATQTSCTTGLVSNQVCKLFVVNNSTCFGRVSKSSVCNSNGYGYSDLYLCQSGLPNGYYCQPGQVTSDIYSSAISCWRRVLGPPILEDS